MKLATMNRGPSTSAPVRVPLAGHAESLPGSKPHGRPSYEAREPVWHGLALVAFSVVGLICAAPLFVPLALWAVRLLTG
jgi:hypothetical protein